MSQKFYKTKQFKELKAEWDQILEQDGFNDIEYPNEMLKEYSSRARNKFSVSKQEYYSRCREFLCNFEFESDLDRLIWAEYAEGNPCRAIAKTIKRDGHSIKKSQVNNIIRKLEAEMMSLKLWEEVIPLVQETPDFRSITRILKN